MRSCSASSRACAPSLLLGLLAFLPAACGDDEEARAWDGLPLWGVERELRIGDLEDPDFIFGPLRALEVGADGTIYTLHPQEPAIRRWSPEGEPAGTIGRRGEGPGEFGNPQALGWRGDSLWVLDWNGYRISFFDPAGAYLGGLSPPVDLGGGGGDFPPRPQGLLADGSIYAVTPAFSDAVVRGTLTRIHHVRADTAGSALDTLAVIPAGPSTILGILWERGGVFQEQFFGDAPQVVPVRDGSGVLVLERAAAADRGRTHFFLAHLGTAGDTIWARSYDYDPVPVPPSVVDSVVTSGSEQLHEFLGERMGVTRSELRERYVEALYAPPHYPPVGELLAGRDGTAWLELRPAEPEGSPWLVVDEEGRPIARVLLPAGLRLLAADQHAVWGVEQDELEVEYIVRYGVVPSGS